MVDGNWVHIACHLHAYHSIFSEEGMHQSTSSSTFLRGIVYGELRTLQPPLRRLGDHKEAIAVSASPPEVCKLSSKSVGQLPRLNGLSPVALHSSNAGVGGSCSGKPYPGGPSAAASWKARRRSTCPERGSWRASEGMWQPA